MNKTILIIIIVLVVTGAAAFLLFTNNSSQPANPSPAVPLNDTSSTFPESNNPVTSTEQGELLAGTASPYYTFTTSAFEQAMAGDKIVFLEFYANWCPVCRSEQPEIINGFNQLDRDDVVGFRANYNDDETDAAEKALAQQLGVTYQHTKIIFKNGAEVHRDGVPWNVQDFLDAIDSIAE